MLNKMMLKQVCLKYILTLLTMIVLAIYQRNDNGTMAQFG